MLKQIKDDAIEEPLTSLDDQEDVEESRKDAKHRRRKQLLKSMMTVGKLIDEKIKGETEVDLKTKKRIPKMSLATKIVNQYYEAKQKSPHTYRHAFTLAHLDRLHELALRRAENLKIPTVKELIKVEEKSVRTRL